MEKLRVGIVFGGKSAEHEVSLQSAKNIVAVSYTHLSDYQNNEFHGRSEAMEKKIGFIGCGNMGKAILGGLIAVSYTHLC